MSSTPPADAVPPIEPAPAVAPAAALPTPPPYVDPYAQVTPPPPPAQAYAPNGYAPGVYPPAYQAGYYAPPPRGLSIASMVTGIVSIVFSVYGFGILPSIAAIITGNLARKRQPYARGFWLAGLICGYIGLGFAVLWIVGIILFVVFVAANPDVQSGSYSVN